MSFVVFLRVLILILHIFVFIILSAKFQHLYITWMSSFPPNPQALHGK